jgi:uncharacterized membrane protein (DUF373 family)
MARKDAGYALKSPRGRTHDVAVRIFDYVEDGIYIVAAALLVVAAVFVLWTAVTQLVKDATTGHFLDLVTHVLDSGLLLFIIAELLHTVRVTIQERTLVVEPFLIVGLIAGVRRLLLLTAQLAAPTTSASEGADQFTWGRQGIEMTVLIGLILAISISLVLYHRYHGPAAEGED